MKLLIALLVFANYSIGHARSVKVVIDDQIYTCSQGGGSSSDCTCKIRVENNSMYAYDIIYNNGVIFSDGYWRDGNAAANALGACKVKIKELPACQ